MKLTQQIKSVQLRDASDKFELVNSGDGYREIVFLTNGFGILTIYEIDAYNMLTDRSLIFTSLNVDSTHLQVNGKVFLNFETEAGKRCRKFVIAGFRKSIKVLRHKMVKALFTFHWSKVFETKGERKSLKLALKHFKEKGTLANDAMIADEMHRIIASIPSEWKYDILSEFLKAKGS